MRQQNVNWIDPQEVLYWHAIRETMRVVFHRDPALAAPLEHAFYARPALERQALYNNEPLDIVADFLEEVPTEAQRQAYEDLSTKFVETPEPLAPGAEVGQSKAVHHSGHQPGFSWRKRYLKKSGTRSVTKYIAEQAVDSLVRYKAETLLPAVPIKQSVTPEYIVCLEDGTKLKMLKRYLKTTYGMSPDEYRAKWGLPKDYPMVAPNYEKAPVTTSNRHRSKSG